MTVSEELWFEIQGAAEDAVAQAKAVAHRSHADAKVKAVLVTAAAAGGVAWYCTCTPSGRKAAKGLFNAGRSRLAKWIAPEQTADQVQAQVAEPVVYDLEVEAEPVSILDL